VTLIDDAWRGAQDTVISSYTIEENAHAIDASR